METRMAEAAVAAPAPEAPAAAGPSGSEAAAILLMLLGDEEAANVLSRLEPTEVQHLGTAMFNVANVSEEQVEGVFDLFLSRAPRPHHDRLRRGAADPLGDGAGARRRPRRKRARPITRADGQPRARRAVGWMDAKTIASLSGERASQIAAACLGASGAANRRRRPASCFRSIFAGRDPRVATLDRLHRGA
jgi:flagellar motor switch protein FliG